MKTNTRTTTIATKMMIKPYSVKPCPSSPGTNSIASPPFTASLALMKGIPSLQPLYHGLALLAMGLLDYPQVTEG
jgi:hypothetical protein